MASLARTPEGGQGVQRNARKEGVRFVSGKLLKVSKGLLITSDGRGGQPADPAIVHVMRDVFVNLDLAPCSVRIEHAIDLALRPIPVGGPHGVRDSPAFHSSIAPAGAAALYFTTFSEGA